MKPHSLQRLYRVEELVRRRRADKHRRHVASQRVPRTDPNPDQIDAVIFALGALPTAAASGSMPDASARDKLIAVDDEAGGRAEEWCHLRCLAAGRDLLLGRTSAMRRR